MGSKHGKRSDKFGFLGLWIKYKNMVSGCYIKRLSKIKKNGAVVNAKCFAFTTAPFSVRGFIFYV